MGTLYQSKGISKSSIAKKLVAVAILTAIFVGLMIFAASSVSGPAKGYAIGGTYFSASSTRARFSSSERQSIERLAYVFFAAALLETVEMGLCKSSWTEIRKDTIHGNFMGKTFSYPVDQITNISRFGEYLIIAGGAGKIGLVTENPAKAHKILNKLLLER